MTLQEYIVTDDCVAKTGLLTDQEIINDITGTQEDHYSDEETCEEMQPRPNGTSQEVSEAILILEDVCLSTSDNLRAGRHLEEFKKIVPNVSWNLRKKAEHHYKLLQQIKACFSNLILMFFLLIRYFSIQIIRTFFPVL